MIFGWGGWGGEGFEKKLKKNGILKDARPFGPRTDQSQTNLVRGLNDQSADRLSPDHCGPRTDNPNLFFLS